MFKKIIEKTIHIISNNTKIVRFSFITSFFHSIYVMIMVLLGINSVINAKYNKWISYNHIFSFLKWDLSIVIIIAIIGFIGYEFIYPIGQAAIINYLNSWQKNIWKAIWKWIEKFFVMFEFNNLLRLFSLVTFWTTILRLAYLDILNNFFVFILLSIRWICVLSATFIRPYTKYTINIEWLNLSDAIKRSTKLAIQNIWITIKFVILEFFLMFRFIFGTLVIIGVPLLIIYITTSLNINNTKLVEIMIYTTVILLWLITTYINGVIEAFFATYRYKVYKHLIKIEDGEKDTEYIDEIEEIKKTKKKEETKTSTKEKTITKTKKPASPPQTTSPIWSSR